MIPIALHEKAIQNAFYKIQREGIKSIAITSANKREGVSALAYALARRAATADVRVLLIDFNLTNSGQTKSLALEQKAWKPNKSTKDGNIVHLSNTNLSILSAPAKTNDSWPFQDQKSIREMIDSMSEKYDLIIADLPSLLDHNKKLQVEIMCSAFDATLLMLLSNKTLETEVTKVRKILEDAKVNLIGVIMNDQFTPKLVDELKRQLGKFEPRMLKLTQPLKKWIQGNSFLNQDL